MKKILFSLITLLFISCSKEQLPEVFTLTITSNPTEGGTITPSSSEYEEGTMVTLEVNTNTHYEFDKWSGSSNSSESPLTITMNSNKNIIGNFKLMDSDGDGVTDDIDNCNSTPTGETVDENGCSDSQKDTDGDGVTDDMDNCTDTPSGETVDSNGCILSPIYLDSNGVTIKCYEWGQLGQTGEINGITYTIVSEVQLRTRIKNREDYSMVCTSKILNMDGLFDDLDISPRVVGDIKSWDVSNVTNMTGMFSRIQVRDDLSYWDVSNVTNMSQMFYSSSFNGDISSWNVGKVNRMVQMFNTSSFNQDISNWDVSNVTSMIGMFWNSSFNQNLSNWDVSNVNNCWSFFGSPNGPNFIVYTEPKPNFTNCDPN